jgi:hypothetical protein
MLYGRLKRHAEAEQHYQRALEIYEKKYGARRMIFPEALGALSMLYTEMGNGDRADAVHERRQITLGEG